MTALWAAWNLLRRIPSEAWLAVGLVALFLVLQAVHSRHDAALEQRGREGALRDATAQQWMWPSERATWQRRIDSLARAVAVQDTVLVTRIRTVQRLVRDTVRDTVRVSTDSLRRACAALADDCAAFRATALASLAVADSTRRADSVAVRALSMRVVERQDAYDALNRSVARTSHRRTVIYSACGASVALNLLQWAGR